MAAIIQFRRDTAANWTSNNPTLAVGEFGYESDNARYKIGDGSTAWTSLGYGGLGDIPSSLIDAKGDFIVGTADNTAGRLAVGTNGQMLVADSAAAGGVSWASQESIVNWHEAVKTASAAALPNTPSYDNGSSGVGATLTTSTQVRLIVDGVNATTGDRVLVQDQSTATHNGIYDVTAQGAAGSAVWLLTRSEDFDGTPTGQIKAGDAVYALAGSTNIGQGFTVTSTSDPHTVGTHDVDFTQFTGTQAFTAGTGVSIAGNTINVGTAGVARIVVNADDIDLATTAVSAAAYGSATAVPGYTVDAYGRLTAAADTTIAIPSTAVTDFTEATQDVAGAQVATNGSHTGISAAYDDAGDGAIDLTLTASGVSAAAYGSATQVPGYTVDTYGRLTAAANTTIAVPSTAVTDFTEAVQDVSGAQFATNGSHTGITAAYDDAGDGAIDLALVTENVEDIVGIQFATNGSHTGITATYDDAGDGAIDLALVTENVQDIVGAQLVTNGSHSGIAATYDDAGDGAIDLNVDDFTITLSGDIGGSVTITDLASATLATTIQANSIALGTDTAGNYLATLAGTANEVEVSGSGSETAAVTVGLPSAVTVTTSLTTPLVNVSGASIVIEGATANDFETTLTVVDPTADRTITLPDITGTVVTTGNLSAATEHIEDTVAAQLVTNGTHSGIAATYDDAGDGAIDLNVDDFTITLGGDLTGSVTITDLANATLTATVAADSVALGTDSTGSYIATVAGTANEIEVSGSGAETAAVTVGLPTNITVGGVLTVSGSIADGAIATTQSQSDNSTKLATTAYVDTGLGALSSDSLTDADADTKIQVEESADEDIIRFDTAGTERMTIAADGTVTITGDLTVNGTETTISSTTITVDDKNIEIGSVATPTDTTADGGGLTLKGATDKTWNWVNSTDAWTSSEHVDLASGKSVYINGVLQLSSNALAATVVLADGVAATTQAANDSTTKVASTAFVMTELADYAPIASPTLTGTPAGPTAAADTNTTQLATTAFVMTEIGDYLTTSTATSTYAPIASPTLTGVPAGPTAAADTNTTQLATTAFVMTEIGDYLTTSTASSTYAPLASPTLTGVPAGPTAAADTNTTQLATTAFVMTEIGDYAPLASPTLTGVPAAPTAAADTNTTQIATTAYVQTELGALSSDSVSDADSDTKIQVEESADEDKIRFDVAGSEFAVMDGSTVDVTGNVIYNLARETQTGTTYTFVVGDRGKYVTMNNGSAQTVTVPPNSSVALAVGTQIQVIGLGAGEITMVAGSGVTLRYTPGLKLRAQYSSCTCIKIATDEWILVGDLEA